MNDLVGIKSLAAMIGLQASTVYVMRSVGKLPDPDEMIDGKPLWHRDTILVWDAGRVKNVAGRGKRC